MTPSQVVTYVDQLEEWTATRADELLSLDELARTSGNDRDQLDVSVAFMSWRAIGALQEQLRALVPAGISDPTPSALSDAIALMSGPVVDPDGSAIGATISEACSIVDALMASARASLSAANVNFERSATLRATARDDLAAAGKIADHLGEQVRHVAELATRLQRPDLDLEALEAVATACAAARSSLEAAAGEQADILARVTSGATRLAALTDTETAVRELADRCRDRILDPPNLAIPAVGALGPPPSPNGTPWATLRTAALEWLARLDRVGAALDIARNRFSEPLQERDDLRGVLQGFRAKAASGGIAEAEHIGNLYEDARLILWSAPCDLVKARAATQAYIEAINLVLSGKV